MEVLCLIPARAGSKGVPNKNIAVVAGRPLIAWTIDAARASKVVTRVVASTDSPEYADICRRHGAEVPFLRPPHLALDDVPALEPTLHALDWLAKNDRYEPDYLILLQPTSPLRSADDIDAALGLAVSRRADAVVSVSPVACHPYKTTLLDAQGRLKPYMDGARADARRQNLPEVFGFNGAIFLIRPAVLRINRTWYPENTVAYVMPPNRSLDIDTPWDLQLADLLVRAQGPQSS